MKKGLRVFFIFILLVVGAFWYFSSSNYFSAMKAGKEKSGPPEEVERTAQPERLTVRDFSEHFYSRGVNGCFVINDLAGDTTICFNPDEAQTAYLPASTFKIANTLIALNEDVIKDTDEIIKWDGKKNDYKVWNQDQTLVTAMKYSCVWVYVRFAEQIGIGKYQKYLKDFNYGNLNLTGPPTYFWLEGPFKISAFQQIDFLTKFYTYKLTIPKTIIDTVKGLIVLEKTPDYTFSGKTGGTKISNNRYIMWLVGYLEKGQKTYFYALNFKTDNFQLSKNHRLGITTAILKELKLM